MIRPQIVSGVFSCFISTVSIKHCQKCFVYFRLYLPCDYVHHDWSRQQQTELLSFFVRNVLEHAYQPNHNSDGLRDMLVFISMVSQNNFCAWSIPGLIFLNIAGLIAQIDQGALPYKVSITICMWPTSWQDSGLYVNSSYYKEKHLLQLVCEWIDDPACHMTSQWLANQYNSTVAFTNWEYKLKWQLLSLDICVLYCSIFHNRHVAVGLISIPPNKRWRDPLRLSLQLWCFITGFIQP